VCVCFYKMPSSGGRPQPVVKIWRIQPAEVNRRSNTTVVNGPTKNSVSYTVNIHHIHCKRYVWDTFFFAGHISIPLPASLRPPYACHLFTGADHMSKTLLLHSALRRHVPGGFFEPAARSSFKQNQAEPVLSPLFVWSQSSKGPNVLNPIISLSRPILPEWLGHVGIFNGMEFCEPKIQSIDMGTIPNSVRITNPVQDGWDMLGIRMLVKKVSIEIITTQQSPNVLLQ
jgi:hypothetical protein